LELDTYDGQAWLGVVPFGMTRVYPRATFPVPWLSRFLEMNVRTYVTFGGRPGVWFFSLDAANSAAVALARTFFHLPYYHAHMRLAGRDGWIHYTSYRMHQGAAPAEFEARYRPAGPVYGSRPGMLEAWLTERYCLYALDSGGHLYRGDIHHAPWPLQPAEAEIKTNTMTLPLGLHLPVVPPLLHYADWLKTWEWLITPVDVKQAPAQPGSVPALPPGRP
jgi:uncharacterized protein YqjF (DUF2071 family)